MDKQKFRRLVVLMHLCAASFMAPAFILVAISGGLYLTGNKGDFKTESLVLPVDAQLSFESNTLEADVRALLKSTDIDHTFEYIKNRGSVIQLRPTSRTYLQFEQTADGLTAIRKIPNFQGSMMELHKGHGPKLFKTYQKLVALMLFFVILWRIDGGIIIQGLP